MQVKKSFVAITIALVASVGVFATGASSALAPEPAKLAAKLDTGRTADAVYVNSSTPTKVVYFSNSWILSANGPAAGTPCSSYALAEGAVTSQVIQSLTTSNGYVYRRCI